MSVPAAQHGKVFATWARTYACAPRDFYVPKTLEEIQGIVQMAHRAGRRIRVCGAGHSPNDCAMSDDILVSLDRFNQVRAVDRTRKLIMVSGRSIEAKVIVPGPWRRPAVYA